MKKIVLLSSDTAHHRYFLNVLRSEGVVFDSCFFETEYASAPFATGPLFEKDQDRWEAEKFFVDVSDQLPEDVATREVGTLNQPAAIEQLADRRPDLGLVFGTGRLSPEVIALFRDGLINVHRGIAEEYRGLDSDLWAIYHRDYGNIGVTVHQVVPRLDTGAIYSERRLPLTCGMKAHQLRYYTTVLATEMVKDVVGMYLTGSLEGRPQERIGRYYSFMPLDLKRVVQARFDAYCARLP